MEIKTKNNEIQLLRAMAIIAVVCIHTCPLGMHQVIIRPFINFAVGLFVFLSGYLTNIENSNWLSFYKKRIIRVIIPYLIWTLIYTLFDYHFITRDFSLFPQHLLFATIRAHLYYIPVYIGLVLITPFMGKLIKSRYHSIVWAITPIFMLLFFYTRFIPQVQINPVVLRVVALCFFGWFSYYYLGILLGNHTCKRTWNQNLLYTLLVISICLQIVEGFALYKIFNYSNCGTQGKLSSLLTNMILLLIVYSFLSSNKTTIKCRFLRIIGDYSFGIYLSHILIINVFSTFSIFSFYKTLPYPVNALVILLVSTAFCYCCDRVFGPKICRCIGTK